VPVWHTVSYCPTSSLVTLALVSAWPSATFLAVIGHRTCMFISYPTLCCWLLYIQWRQCECNFGGDEEGIKEQLQGIRESPVFIRRQRWPYRERRESLRSLCKYSGTRSKRKFTRKNDNCGYWIRFFFLSLFASMEASHRVHAAKEVNCHAV